MVNYKVYIDDVFVSNFMPVNYEMNLIALGARFNSYLVSSNICFIFCNCNNCQRTAKYKIVEIGANEIWAEKVQINE